MAKKKILIIGAGDFQLPLVQKAAKNCEVYLAAPEIDERFSSIVNKTLITDVRNKDIILEFARVNHIDGVITDQTDVAVRTVAYVAEKLELPGIGYDTSCLFSNKAKMRLKLKELGIDVLPNKNVFSLSEALDFFDSLKNDVIIKPVDTQGSRGIYLCKNKEDIISNFEKTLQWSKDKGIVIEKYASGREFFVESIVYNYDYKPLILGDCKQFESKNVFSSKERIVPSDADFQLQESVLKLNEKIIRGFGLKQGISQSEYITDNNKVYLVETGARGGGGYTSSDFVNLMTGVDTENFLINIALGQCNRLPAFKLKEVACQYIAFYLPKGKVLSVEGLREVLNLPYVHRNQIEKLYVGYENRKENTDKTSRYIIVISAQNREELKQRANKIKSMLKIQVDTISGIKGPIWQ